MASLLGRRRRALAAPSTRRSGHARAHARRGLAAAAAAAAILLLGLSSACSLGNISADPCTTNIECETAFGAGSQCKDGYCTPVTNQGCNSQDANGNACYSCPPTKDVEFHNGCTDAQCSPFDKARLTKLNPDGSLPALP